MLSMKSVLGAKVKWYVPLCKAYFKYLPRNRLLKVSVLEAEVYSNSDLHE
jgi:hypothetical protein